MKGTKLTSKQLQKRCDASQFKFKTTAELDVLEGVIEQERAVRSLKTGLNIDKRNYNVFVAGASGTGRTTIVRTIIKDAAGRRPTPSDWALVYNFRDRERPCALEFPPGKGRKFAADMDWLVDHLKEELPRAFRERDHQEEVQQIVSGSLVMEHENFVELSEQAASVGFSVKSTKTGLVTVPLKEEKALTNKEYEALTPEEKKEIEERRRQLDPHIHDFVSKTRDIEAGTQAGIKRKQESLARQVCSRPIRRLKRRYSKVKRVGDYLSGVRDHILANLARFVAEPEEGGNPVVEAALRSFVEYKVNVVVDNGELEGAPLIVEPRPSYYNLFGKVEKKVENGVYFTDFTMVKAGSVLRANGGYLLINTNDLFAYPLVWENLKTILRYRESTIEDMGEHLGVLPTSGIRPEPIPVSMKIVLIGPAHVYDLLYRHDEDFRKLFQVKSEFDFEMKRTADSVDQYARFVATTCRNEGLRQVTADGVAAIVEFGSRLVDSKERVTLQFNEICNMLIEADSLAGEDSVDLITRGHLAEALAQREYRLSLLEEKLREEILEHSIFIAVSGDRVGAVNGLAVYEVGNALFGKPARITAAVYAGKAGIVNVERESKLSGRIHSKGILIISGYLGATFGQTEPLSVTVSVCFEQSYGHIDGDSASIAELSAILSSLSGVPLKQGFAVTGSVNQQGDVQPVGGINEKIEAWFQLCLEEGLTGEQGVVIPAANVRNLMLKDEVVAAVADGRFAVHTVSRVEEAVEILTGRSAGQAGPKGRYGPEDSVYALAQETLCRYGEVLQGDD